MTSFAFSPVTFDRLLTAIGDAGFSALTFDKLVQGKSYPSKTILLRHDIDVSMDYAHAMAIAEAKHEIQATYFFMLRSPLYNLWSRHSASLLKEIAAMGHGIGLHYDAGYAPTKKTLEDDIIYQTNVLSTLADKAVKSFSFHQPTPQIIEAKVEVGTMINTYNPNHLIDFHYMSDSNRVWRDLDPFEALLSNYDHVQLLLHPIWWMCEKRDVYDCWDEAILQNFNHAQEQMLATERAYGPSREMRLKR